ncbi:hypothetical protein CR513_59663, partial [Mucuna pruriens]
MWLSIPHQNPKSYNYKIFSTSLTTNTGSKSMFGLCSAKMLHSHHNHLLFSTLPVPLSLTHHHSLPSLHFLHRPTTRAVSATPPEWLTQLTTQDLGPIELPFPTPSSLFTDDPSTIQVVSSLLLSGAITLFFFRSVQRRAKRAKELKFRSSGVKKSLDNLKAMRTSSIKAKNPPSPDQALLGAIIAGVIAVLLYRFTTSIEATLGRQTLSDNFSVCIIYILFSLKLLPLLLFVVQLVQ